MVSDFPVKNDDSGLDVLYLHVPKFSAYYKPFDEYMTVSYISVGLFALADLTNSAGFPSRIVHLGVEWICDNNFSIIDYVARTRPKVLAVPIFWHPQSYDAMSVIRAVKAKFPEIFIVTGGFTASYFADEIMRDFPEIDAVVRGHGEASITELVRRVVAAASSGDGIGGLDLSSIPNLLWRRKFRRRQTQDITVAIAPPENAVPAAPEIVVNPENYFATSEDLDRLNYTNLSLLSNYLTYVCSFRINVAYSKRLTRADNLRLTRVRSYNIPVAVGRGCPTECKLCSGRNATQKKMNGSGCVVMCSPEKVYEQIVELKKYGYEEVIICFDPYPDKPDYFIKIFRMLRENNVKIDMLFESWGLPTAEFIREFAATFPGRNSVIAISAESGSDAVRKKIRGYHFTNEKLLATLDLMEESRVSFLVFFTVGNPCEKYSDLEETEKLIKQIMASYKFGIPTSCPIQIEPGSAIFEEPDKYGVEKIFSCFKDYVEFHGRPDSCIYTNLGYNVREYFPEGTPGNTPVERIAEFSARISALRCEKFCFLHPDPEFAREFCEKLRKKYEDAGFGSFDTFVRGSFV